MRSRKNQRRAGRRVVLILLSKKVEFKCSMRGEKQELEIGKKQQS